MKRILPLCPLLATFLLIAAGARADFSAYLTDTIQKGAGSINLLKDITGAQLAQQVTPSGKLFFAIDLNENAGGNESGTSVGTALQSMELTVVTTTGTYHFSNASTNTTAVLSSVGTTQLNTYYTMFGQAGSSQLTSQTPGFDLALYNDVLVLNNVSFTGDVLSAQMSIQLVNTGKSKAANDTFFDFTGGPEDLAMLSAADALALENAGIGLPPAGSGITYSTLAPVVTASDVSGGSGSTGTGSGGSGSTGGGGPSTPPAAPMPGLLTLLALCVLLVARRFSASSSSSMPPASLAK